MQFSLCRTLILAVGLAPLVPFGTAQAQPSDARIIQDLKGPGVLSVKLLGRGARVWSRASSQYVWDRSAVVVRQANIPEYPNAKVEIVGIATYSIVGGRFPFKKFYVSYNRYNGIPTPSAAQITKLLNSKLPEFLGHYYNSVVGNVQPITLAANPKWNWHTPNSVSFLVNTGFSTKVSSTQLEKQKVTFEVRLYRDKVKSPWKDFHSSRHAVVSLGKSTHSEDELKAMPTLNTIAQERVAKARLAALPAVSIPEFKTDLELFAFLHKTLRAGDARKTEAVLRRLLSPAFFVEGSSMVLQGDGEDLIQTVLRKAYGGKISYAEQYPEDLHVDGYQPGMLSFWNADRRHASTFKAERAGGTWQNGVKVGQTYRIQSMTIGVVTDADEIARLRSMAPATRFAPPQGATLFSQLGQRVADQQQAQAQAQQVRALQWTPYTSTQGRMTIAFPAKATEIAGQMNGKYPMWTVEATSPQVLCRAISINYGTRLNRMQAQTTVDSALKGLAQNNNATVKSVSEINEGTYGRLAVLEAGDTVIKARVFVQGEMLYQLVMSGSSATMATLNERAFFGTFQPLR
jgi:hypothetical protein